MEKDLSKTQGPKYPKGVDFTISGIDPSQVIRSMPEMVTEGIQLNLLWDNDIVKFIKDSIVKLFRHR